MFWQKCSIFSLIFSLYKVFLQTDILRMREISHSKQQEQKKTTKVQNYNKMETKKSIYCDGYSIDSIDLCIYIVD